MVICYKKSRANNTNRRQSYQNKRNIPKKFCHFVLYKQNKDTMDCINLLAKKMRINAREFSYAGTKDRRATTIQRVAVRNTLSSRLHQLNKCLRNIVLGNFEYRDTPLQLGDLSGNEFTLVIRDISGVADAESDVNVACGSLKEHGFINYFGLQRFGTGGSPTHEIGMCVLNILMLKCYTILTIQF